MGNNAPGLSNCCKSSVLPKASTIKVESSGNAHDILADNSPISNGGENGKKENQNRSIDICQKDTALESSNIFNLRENKEEQKFSQIVNNITTEEDYNHNDRVYSPQIKKKAGVLYLSSITNSPLKIKSLIDISNLQIKVVSRKKAYKCLPKIDFDENGNSVLVPSVTSMNFLKYQSNHNTNSTYNKSSIGEGARLVVISDDLPSIQQAKEIISTTLDEQRTDFVKNILIEEQIVTGDMDEETIEEILSSITYIKIQENTIIFTKGMEEHHYYIIESGKLEYSIDGKIDFLIRGDSLGTSALEKEAKLECYLKTTEPSYLFSLPIEAYKNSLINQVQKERSERINTLKGFPIFRNLDKKDLTLLASKMKKGYYKERIVSCMEVPSSMYIILEGEVKCTKGGEVYKTLSPKEAFGDLQLFCYMEPFFNYIAEKVVLLYELPYSDIIDILGKDYIHKFVFSLFTHCLQKSENLSKYYKIETLNTLFNVFQLKYYFNDVVVSPSNTKKICMIISGRLIKGNSNKNNSLSPSSSIRERANIEIIAESGDLYGESLIDSVEGIDYNVITEDEAIVYEANWVDITKSLKFENKNKDTNGVTSGNSNKTITIYDIISLLKPLHFFSQLSDLKLFLISSVLKSSQFKHNEVIIKEGPVSDKLYIIKKGKVKVVINNIPIKDLESGAYFGDIINSPDFYSKKACFIASDKVECYVLDKDTYEEIIDSSLLKPLQSVLVMKDITIQIDQLYFLKELGFGNYGKVYLVHNKKKFYAVKASQIQYLRRNKHITQYYLNEKSIMSKIDHPFIVQLINTLKNEDFLFFIIEFIDGITLKNYLMGKKRDSFRNLSEVEFFSAILLVVVNYLQRKRIIHRDLKPDNCMIDKTGYLKVIDFGVAQDLTGKDYTHTVLGTPHYMAPETLLGKGYNYSVDYWAVGVILYEIFYGSLPFGHNSEDLAEIYREILEKKLHFPNDQRYMDFNNFLNALLTKNPLKRTCSFKKLRSHPFLEDFDFDKLMEFKMKPPYRPTTADSELLTLNNLDYPFEHFIQNSILYLKEDIVDENEANLNKQLELLSDF